MLKKMALESNLSAIDRKKQSFIICNMFQERTLRIGERAMNCAVGPENGPPLLLCHGVTRRWQAFRTVMSAYAAHYHVWAIDFRGHGRSDRAERYLVADYIQDIETLVQHQFRVPVVLIGHSLGALVSAGVAAALPTQVAALVLEDPPSEVLLKTFRSTIFHSLFQLFRMYAGSLLPVDAIARELGSQLMPLQKSNCSRVGGVRDAVSIRFSARCLKDADPETLTPILEERWLEGCQLESVYRGIQCPTLLLRADEAQGGMLVKQEGDKIAQWIPSCTTLEWPGVGHVIHWQEGEALARFAIHFLASI